MANGGFQVNGGKDRIAFTCQRYGPEVNGGAELHCRQLAERLSAFYDVTVYTTCAKDYMTWKNEYPAGEEEINGVRVKRFPVAKERDQEAFARLSQAVFHDPLHTDRQEQEWIDEQGPYCPGLISALKEEHGQYKRVLFMTYLYYLTARGLPLDFRNAVLIPTLHDEPPAYLRHYGTVFAAAKEIAWNTEEEKRFAEERFPAVKDTPGIMAGVGIDGPQGELPEIPEAIRGVPYLVYAGRIDESKGCGDMFRYFLRYKQENPGDLKLVLMGKPVMEIPEDGDIVSLGFVTDGMKFAVMKEALALVLFSRFESLSMVVLESMLMRRPVLVDGACEVLKGHCRRSGAGLYFDNYPEFACAVKWMEAHPEEYAAMRRNGEKYVRENYRWDVIADRYRQLFGDL